MTPSIDKLFVSPGKRYHGVRYPESENIREMCIVTAQPSDGQPYELDKATKTKFIAEFFNWGGLLCNMPKIDPPIIKPRYASHLVYEPVYRARSEKAWKEAEKKRKQLDQLAFAILLDYYENDKLASATYELLRRKIIEKLPEKEFTLTASQIEDAVGAEIALAAIAKIGE